MSLLAAVSPNAAAQRLIGRDYISFSALSLFRQCSLRFFFKYIVGLPEPTVSANLVFGSAIHASIEYHFRELLAGNSSPTLLELLHVYRAAWQERADREIQYGKGEDRDALEPVAERMLAAFQNSDLAQPSGTIIGIEEELRGPLMAELPDLLARIDLLVDTGEQIVVTDLKTSRSRWSQGHAEDSAEQLLLYGELIRDLIPGRKVALQFAVITKGKKPAIDCHSVKFSSRRIARTRAIVKRVWRAIEAGNFFPAPSPLNCPGCPYRKQCRAWTGSLTVTWPVRPGS